MSTTIEGKFESSRNALTHGLTAANIDRFSEETRESFRAYLGELYNEWKPQTLNEKTFLERYAFNQFQLLRSESLVDNALTALLANPEDEKAQKRHANMTRHLRAIERSTKDALKELRTMIADRLVETAAALAQGIEPLAVMTPHHLLRKAFPAPPPAQEVRFVKASEDMPPLVREMLEERKNKGSR